MSAAPVSKDGAAREKREHERCSARRLPMVSATGQADAQTSADPSSQKDGGQEAPGAPRHVVILSHGPGISATHRSKRFAERR